MQKEILIECVQNNPDLIAQINACETDEQLQSAWREILLAHPELHANRLALGVAVISEDEVSEEQKAKEASRE